MFDEKDELLFWTLAIVKILDIRHGLLIRQPFEEVFENSIWLFLQGKKARIRIGDKDCRLHSNGFFHIPADRKILIEVEEELEYFLIEYQAQLPPDASREESALSLRHCSRAESFSLRLSNPGYIARQLTDMKDARHRGGTLESLRIKQLFYAVLYSIFHERRTGKASPVPVDVFEQAKLYLEENYAQSNPVRPLADSLGVTRASLYERFKRRMGISPQQFVMQKRLDAACLALSEEGMSLDEIAVSCGLRDKSYFSRVFKQKYGISPGSYRREQSGKAGKRASGLPRSAFSSPSGEYRLIENFGRLHRYYGIPTRVVCMDYPAAEFCMALGVGERLVGIASAEGSLMDCMEKYREKLAKIPFIHGRSLKHNVPNFETVLHLRPDLVIGSSYSFRSKGGVADASEFERLGIHIYALQATCLPGGSFEDVYADIFHLGQIFAREERAKELILSLRKEEENLRIRGERALRVFCFDSVVQGKAFTCGHSLESYIIRRAGGRNIFEDRASIFVPVDWKEVAAADPQVILVHRFHDSHDSDSKIEFLKRVSEIQGTEAIRKGNFLTLGMKEVFPNLGILSTTRRLGEFFDALQSPKGSI